MWGFSGDKCIHFAICSVDSSSYIHIVFTLDIQTPLRLTILVLNLNRSILLPVDVSKTAGRVENGVGPDQMPHTAGFDLALYCKLWPACPNTVDSRYLKVSRDSLKYFEITVPGHIKFAELRKKQIKQHLTNEYVI